MKSSRAVDLARADASRMEIARARACTPARVREGEEIHGQRGTACVRRRPEAPAKAREEQRSKPPRVCPEVARSAVSSLKRLPRDAEPERETGKCTYEKRKYAREARAETP